MNKIFYGENENQFGELRIPEGDGPHPVAIVIHGGFWRMPYALDLMDNMCEDLTLHGIATWNIEYRRVGQDGGAWPGTLTDVAQAADYLYELAEKYPLDLNQVISIGHSAGGHLAVWLAARHRLPKPSELNTSDQSLPISGTVSLAGVTDLKMMHGIHDYRDKTFKLDPNNPTADLLKGSPNDCPDRYSIASPIELLPIRVPQVLIHGSLDINVPIGISNYYYRKAKEAGDFVKLIELPTTEHFMLIDTSTEAWSSVREEMMLLINN